MRIGLLATVDPNDPDNLSGMPNAMKRQLERMGAEVVDLLPECARPRSLPSRVARRLANRARRWMDPSSDGLERGGDPLFDDPDRAEAAFLRLARESSLEVAARLSRERLDLLFGCCVSTLLYELETSIPIIYYSDTTARLINAAYPEYARKPVGYHRACDRVEAQGLARVSAAIFATYAARESAVRHYELAPERAHVVPLGANVKPSQERKVAARPCPARERLKLVITAADPERKRTDLAVEAAEILERWGFGVELRVIGSITRRAAASPLVEHAGYLRLSSSRHMDRHRELLADSDLMLLPSTGEAFGIAPCEAAHWGVPSVVSEAGGLPEVVCHELTGLVLAGEASAEDYARSVADLVSEPRRYERMSAAALSKARSEYTWERWGERVSPILESLLGEETSEAGATAAAHAGAG